MEHHNLSLLLNITMALVWAFAGGVLARRLGLPTLVGYLLAGVAIGPFTPGFIGDTAQIGQLAEIGVVFLMFGVGLHFSLRDLWEVRKVAIPGAVIQMTGSTVLAFALALSWGWSPRAGLILGLAVSIASTVVLLRGLMDNGLLNSTHGRVAVGWLVLEDLATILILVLLPPLFSQGEGGTASVIWGLLKAAGFVVLILVVGRRLLPWLLMKITFTRSRELFILSVVAVALGTAVGSAEIFGVSLALGAFLGGVVLGRSSTSHHISAEIAPFRDVFTVLFFVSVGMLVNPHYLLTHIRQVLELTALIMIAKTALTLFLGFILPAPPRTMIVVAAGLSQIGEFSFIVGQAGVSLGILQQEQYSLILAGAVLSIMLNPFMFGAIGPLERGVRRVGFLWRLMARRIGAEQSPPADREGHVVIIGSGRVGGYLVYVLEHMGIPALVVENDPAKMNDLNSRGIPVLYGDAANSEILDHASLAKARALVVTVSDEAAAEIVVAFARQSAPALPVIVRGMTVKGVERLAELGATVVIHPELEGGLEIMRNTLLFLGIPAVQVQEYADEVRRDHYDLDVSTVGEQRVLAQMMAAVRGMEVVWRKVGGNSAVAGTTLAQADLRRRIGVSLIAIIRGSEIITNPDPSEVLQVGDTVGLLGTKKQVSAAEGLINPEDASRE
ncbi:cation:proton antiporter [Geomonas sp. RF6]|uniref:cation:proton antiporter domain-containing protein n=1 Tax=Geomonas sp. RF6 TaxID=2897342 RepID=UPI001E340437|nr:cation:proton antiporter [Geomonas sp. RF6]UFS70223.1 cation:proton antiporter [Geomonas sp. RF6]